MQITRGRTIGESRVTQRGLKMDKSTVRIGELKFELVIPQDDEVMPALEVENDASMIFESISVPDAIQLRKLLDEFIEQMSNS